MSMTSEELHQLSSFGQIPAETDISAVVERFWDDCIGRFDAPITYQAIAAKNGSTDLTTGKTAHPIDASSSLSAFVQDSHSRVLVLLLIQLYANASYSINLTYRDGDNTTDTTTSYRAYSWGNSCPMAFMWTVTPTNWAKNVKCYPFSNSTVHAKYMLLGFPYRV